MPSYECVRCGEIVSEEEWTRTGDIPGSFRCPNCSYKVARKIRPPVVKRVNAI